MTVGTTI